MCGRRLRDITVNGAIIQIENRNESIDLIDAGGYSIWGGDYIKLLDYKPLNKFQIWMFKVCFGIKARNTERESII